MTTWQGQNGELCLLTICCRDRSCEIASRHTLSNVPRLPQSQYLVHVQFSSCTSQPVICPMIKDHISFSLLDSHSHHQNISLTSPNGTFEASSIPFALWRMLSKSCRDRTHLASCYTRILASAYVELSASNYWRGTYSCTF